METYSKVDDNTICLTRTTIILRSREELDKLKKFYEGELIKIQALIDDIDAKILFLDS